MKAQPVIPEIIRIIRRQWNADDLGEVKLTRKNLKELKEERKGLKIKKLPGNIGKGVFLKRSEKPIEKGEVIGPYAGELSLMPQSAFDDADYAFDPVTDLTLTKEEQKKFDPKAKFHPRRLYALKLDAKRRGNFTRFVNHSKKPNVEAYLASTKENPYQIIYFAKKRIMPGEQLLINYEAGGGTYWKPLKIKPFPMSPRTFMV